MALDRPDFDDVEITDDYQDHHRVPFDASVLDDAELFVPPAMEVRLLSELAEMGRDSR